MSPASQVQVDVEGRTLSLTNLDKVLYPETGFSKGQVLDYYTRIAPVLLPHLNDRPLTLKRYPNGVAGHAFFEKNAPPHRPDWVRTVTLAAPGSTKDRAQIDYLVVTELAVLVWVAQLASLELHVPQWRVGPRGGVRDPDLLVIDLDPGPPANVTECAQLALLLRARCAADQVALLAKTSGSKGLQLAAHAPGTDTSAYAKQLAQDMARSVPELAVSRMSTSLRAGKVFVDWSQNNPAKTTIAVYSLRARPEPTVSTPVTWEEVAACADGAPLRFTADEVLLRVAEHGDLWAELA